MTIFNSYVKLPEGTCLGFHGKKMEKVPWTVGFWAVFFVHISKMIPISKTRVVDMDIVHTHIYNHLYTRIHIWAILSH